MAESKYSQKMEERRAKIKASEEALAKLDLKERNSVANIEKHPEYFQEQSRKLGDSEFEGQVATRLGPLAKGTVDADKVDHVWTKNPKGLNLSGRYFPPQTTKGEISESNRDLNRFLTKESKLPTRGSLEDQKDMITTVGTPGADVGTLSHEFRHRKDHTDSGFGTSYYPYSSLGKVDIRRSEWGNRLHDAYTATNKDEWKDSVKYFKDSHPDELRAHPDIDWEDELLKTLTEVDSGMSRADSIHKSEYRANPGWFPNEEYLNKQSEAKDKGILHSIFGPGELSRDEEAKDWRQSKLYFKRLLDKKGRKGALSDKESGE